MSAKGGRNLLPEASMGSGCGWVREESVWMQVKRRYLEDVFYSGIRVNQKNTRCASMILRFF